MQEYLSSKDVSEARHCLRKLAVPFFHHEVVKQALLRCMEEEEDSSNEDTLVQLLKQLSSTGDISASQMARVKRNHNALSLPYCEQFTAKHLCCTPLAVCMTFQQIALQAQVAFAIHTSVVE